MYLLITRLIVLLGLAAGSGHLFAAAEPSADLTAQVRQILNDKAGRLAAAVDGSRFQASVRPLPSELGALACDFSPVIDVLTGFEAGAQRIKVTCRQPVWSIYMKGYIRIHVPVLVSRYNLPRGALIRPGDLVAVDKEISQLRRGYIPATRTLTRTETRKAISAGKILTPAMLRPAVLVRQGDRIELVASNKGILVSMPGTALENGALDEMIRVKNLSSDKILRGRVVARSKVSVW